MKFSKYTSLTNHYESRYINSIVMEGYAQDGVLWVAREKIHGCNFSFITDGKKVTSAKRSGVIGEMESFYDSDSVVLKYTDKILSVFEQINKEYPVSYIQVYGELAGPGVQKEVYYGDEKDFWCFDIRVTTPDDRSFYLSDTAVATLCNSAEIKMAPLLGYGSFDQLRKLPITFQSVVGCFSKLAFVGSINGLTATNTTVVGISPATDETENIAEGYVLKPVHDVYIRAERVVVKCKTDKFKEKKNKQANAFKENITLSGSDKAALENALLFICDNRLRNVLSKLDVASLTARDFGKVHGLLTQDALQEIEREEGKPFISMFENPSLAKRTFNQESAKLVRDVWSKILSNEF